MSGKFRFRIEILSSRNLFCRNFADVCLSENCNFRSPPTFLRHGCRWRWKVWRCSMRRGRSSTRGLCSRRCHTCSASASAATRHRAPQTSGWPWSVSLADHGQHADRSDVLRAVRRSLNNSHPVFRHFQATLPRKGCSLYLTHFTSVDVPWIVNVYKDTVFA